MITILIRKGLNGFRYSACGEKGNFLFNANQIGRITSNWSKEKKTNTVQFIRQLDLLPGDNPAAAGTDGASVGARMRETRIKRGLTQREAARLIDVPCQTYADMEKGRAYISRHKLMILSVKLRESHEWLSTGKGGRFL